MSLPQIPLARTTIHVSGQAVVIRKLNRGELVPIMRLLKAEKPSDEDGEASVAEGNFVSLLTDSSQDEARAWLNSLDMEATREFFQKALAYQQGVPEDVTDPLVTTNASS